MQDIKRCDKFWSADKIILIDFIANNDKMKAYCKKVVGAKQISLIQRIRSFSTLSNYSDLNTLGYPLKKAIVVHDHCSSTFRLERTPSITYLSIFKELSSEEMKSLIRAKYKEINDEIKASQEQERRELEEARNAQMQLQSEIKRINKEYEEGQREYIASNLFKNAVMSWLKPSCANMKCYSMYYYYPTTCDFEVSQYDWDIRNLIWNFKANPLRQMSNETIIKLHEEAVSEIVVDMEKCLKHFFGDDTRYLTLACVPSSKAVINHRRYKDFSEIICERTHMENGYQYIRITIDGEAKHVGGNNEAIYEIDNEFFKDKNILIFDDVITSGRSMEQLRSRLLGIGANVIGGFSIGITKHEWRANHPIDLIEKDFNR